MHPVTDVLGALWTCGPCVRDDLSSARPVIAVETTRYEELPRPKKCLRPVDNCWLAIAVTGQGLNETAEGCESASLLLLSCANRSSRRCRIMSYRGARQREVTLFVYLLRPRKPISGGTLYLNPAGWVGLTPLCPVFTALYCPDSYQVPSLRGDGSMDQTRERTVPSGNTHRVRSLPTCCW